MKPGSDEWKERVFGLFAEEMGLPERWFYCSFTSYESEGFLGGLFIKARGITDISLRTHREGINPGGEMMAVELYDGAPMPAEEFRGRLLTKEELERACGPLVKSDGSAA